MGTLVWKIWAFLPLGEVQKRLERFFEKWQQLFLLLEVPSKPQDRQTNNNAQGIYNCESNILELYEAIGSQILWALLELGDRMKQMRKCEADTHISAKLKASKAELSLVISMSKISALENSDALVVASLDKVEELTKEVDQVGDIAGFGTHSTLALPRAYAGCIYII